MAERLVRDQEVLSSSLSTPIPFLSLRVRAAALVGCALIAWACVPPHRDPFAGLDMSHPAYPDLTVVIIPSENTKALLGYSRKAAHFSGGQVDPESSFERVAAVFRAHFKSVGRAGSMEEAVSARPDLIAVLDSISHDPNMGGREFRVDAISYFVTTNKSEVDTVKAYGSRMIPAEVNALFAHSMKIYGEAVNAAHDDLVRNFEAALKSSAKLAELEKAQAAALMAAPAAAPAKLIVSDVDHPAYRKPEDPDKLAVVFGVERYTDLPEARFAERDAAAMREHLLALGYPQRNIVYLTGERASRAGLAKHLESWLPQHAGKASTVFFYYSGHGAPDVKTGRAYLVPMDGDVRFLDQTAYPVARVYEKLAALGAREVIVVLDACFSGAGGRSVIPKGTRPLITKIDAGTPDGKILVLSASAGDEITGAFEDQGHGIFTYYLLKGLNDNRGEATVKRLYDYLLPRVRDGARKDNRDQTPQLMPSADHAGITL